jgi:hypothetical protein
MKKYKDFSAEEKEEYKRKRDEYWSKRNQKMQESIDALKKEVGALTKDPIVTKRIYGLIDNVQNASVKKTGTTRSSGTHLTTMFGTETPKIGQVVTFKYVSVRGPNGERLNENETVAQFVTRVGDVDFKYDDKSIHSMVWYTERRGYKIKEDVANKTLTFLGTEEKEQEMKVELVKKQKVVA